MTDETSIPIGIAEFARQLGVPYSAAQNWPRRDDFPEPAILEPKAWHLDDLLSWARDHQHLPALRRRREGPPKKGGLPPDEWPKKEGHTSTRPELTRLLNTRNPSLTKVKGFPSPATRNPDQWVTADVLKWALENAHRKGLASWVCGTWGEGRVLDEGQVDLPGIAARLGISVGQARYYAFNEPTFPDEDGALSRWKLDEVIFWAQHEAPEEIQNKLVVKLDDVEVTTWDEHP